MKRTEIYRKIVRLLTIIGGTIGIFLVFFKLYEIENVELWILNLGIGSLIFINIGFLIAGFTIVTGLKPDQPIPWHWITLIVLAAFNFIFVNFVPAIFVLISSVLELVKEL